MGLIYFGIRVTDLGRSLEFYVRGLGLNELRRSRLPHGGRRVLLVDRKTAQRLELNWYPERSPYAVPYVAGEGLDHLGFSAGHAAEMARRLVEHGGKVVLRPTDPRGVRQNFYVEDPDGNWIELMGWSATNPPVSGASTTRLSPRTKQPRTSRDRSY